MNTNQVKTTQVKQTNQTDAINTKNGKAQDKKKQNFYL